MSRLCAADADKKQFITFPGMIPGVVPPVMSGWIRHVPTRTARFTADPRRLMKCIFRNFKDRVPEAQSGKSVGEVTITGIRQMV